LQLRWTTAARRKADHDPNRGRAGQHASPRAAPRRGDRRGIAGLLAARVLSDHFERVTLLERHSLARAPAPRRGVPQGAHVHVLLARGLAVAEGLFPGLAEELRAAGAVQLNSGRDLRWHHSGG